MKPSQLIPFLKTAFTNRRQVLIKGAPGVGKSDIIDKAAMEAGMHMIVRHPSVEDPCDSRGLPGFDTDPTGIKVAKFFPFEDLAMLINAKVPTVVHLEDFGQAPVSVQAGWMQLLLRRMINGHRLSEYVTFTASTNDVNDGAGVGGLLEPVKSRFDTIVKLDVSCDDWITWGLDNAMPPWLLAYINKTPDALHEFKATRALTNSPCPRNWSHIGVWDNLGIADLEVWSGAVGEGRAAEAYAFRDGAINMPNPDQCLLNPDTAPLPSQPSLRLAVTAAISYRVKSSNFDQAIRYCIRLDKSFEILLVKSALRRDQALADTEAFARWTVNPENRDICL